MIKLKYDEKKIITIFLENDSNEFETLEHYPEISIILNKYGWPFSKETDIRKIRLFLTKQINSN